MNVVFNLADEEGQTTIRKIYSILAEIELINGAIRLFLMIRNVHSF